MFSFPQICWAISWVSDLMICCASFLAMFHRVKVQRVPGHFTGLEDPADGQSVVAQGE